MRKRWTTIVKNRSSDSVEMLIGLGAKPTDDMLDYAMRKENLNKAVALINGGAMPDEAMLDYAKDNLNSAWAKMFLKAIADNNEKLRIAARNKAAADKVKALEKEKVDMLDAVKQMQRQLGKPAARPARSLMTLKG